jgi:WD40 repeat protein
MNVMEISDAKNVVIGGFRNVVGNIHVGDIFYSSNAESPGDPPQSDLPPPSEDIGYPQYPYIGLRPFDRGDARIFFGRNKDILALLTLIESETADQIILLSGQSGVGKSSILKAGVTTRLEKTWPIHFIGPQVGIPLMTTIQRGLSNIPATNDKQLIVFDQVEEIFTIAGERANSKKQGLGETIKEWIDQNHKAKFILSYRKEYSAELELSLTTSGLNFTKVYLSPLDPMGVQEAIVGIMTDSVARIKYRLTIDKRVKDNIVAVISQDKESNIAPALQVLLRRLWDIAVAESEETRVINEAVYEKINGILLEDFLKEQIQVIRKSYPQFVESGLILDILEYFVTADSTADRHSWSEIASRYGHIPDVKAYVEVLKDSYLLTDVPGDSAAVRLTHDALAPLVLQLFHNSNYPGQIARRILEFRSHKEMFVGDNEWYLTAGEDDIIEAGKAGMRACPAGELELIIKSKERRLKEEQVIKDLKNIEEKSRRERRRTKKILVWGSISVVFVVLVLGFVQQSITATQERVRKSASLSTESILGVGQDLNRSFETAMRALSYDSNSFARNALFSAYDYKPFFYKDSVYFSPFYRIIDSSGKFGEGPYTAVFSPDGRFIIAPGRRDGHAATLVVYDLNGRVVRKLTGHEDDIQKIDIRERQMVSVGWDGKAILWNIAGEPKNWKMSRTILRGDEQLGSVAFSHDGSKVLIGGDNAYLYDSSGNLIHLFKTKKSPDGVAFSADGKYLCIGDGSKAEVYDSEFHMVSELVGHDLDIRDVHFSPVEDLIVTASNDQTARIWNVSGTLISTLYGHADEVRSAEFSNDGKYIVTSSNDDKIDLWSVKRHALLTEFIGYQSDVSDCHFSPGSMSLVSAGGDGTVRLWDIRQKPVQTFRHYSKGVKHACFSSSNSFLAMATQDSLYIWNVTGKRPDTVVAMVVGGIDFSSDSSLLLLSGKNLLKWDLRHRPVKIRTFQESVYAVKAIGADKIAVSSRDSLILLNANGDKIDGISVSGQINLIQASNSGNSFIVAAGDLLSDRLILWIPGRQPKTLYDDHEKYVQSAAISSDGSEIAIGQFGGDVKIVDSAGKVTGTINTGLKLVDINAVGFSTSNDLFVLMEGDLVLYDRAFTEYLKIGSGTGILDPLLAKGILSSDGKHVFSFADGDPVSAYGYTELWDLDIPSLISVYRSIRKTASK